MADFNLAVVTIDRQTAKFNSPPNFPAVRYAFFNNDFVPLLQDASMVNCMGVWLIASLGSQVMEKAITVLGSNLYHQIII